VHPANRTRTVGFLHLPGSRLNVNGAAVSYLHFGHS
jgi:hypothetical protein